MTEYDVERIGVLLTDLHAQPSSARKDGWDKAGVVAQLLSGVVIAGLGIGIAWTASHSDRAERERESQLLGSQAAEQLKQQAAQAKAQLDVAKEQSASASAHDKAELDLESKKSVADYIALLKSGTDGEQRAEILGFLGASLQPSQAVDIAIDYAHPPFDFLEWTKARALI